MEYILIPSNSKAETTFFLNLFKKMQKEASALSAHELEDVAFMRAIKEGETSGKGSLAKVKAYLSKATGKRESNL